jgi:hypothetical protein
VDAYERAAGRQVAWVYFSNNWFRSRAFPKTTAEWIRSRGAVPFIRLMLRSSTDTDIAEPTFKLSRIINGDFDADLRAWGDAAKTFNTPLIVEWGTEANGQWFSWNGVWNGGANAGPKAFRDAYRHIVTVVRARGATNITWVFHVDAQDDPEVAWNALEKYYPGDDVVDWLGISAYGAQSPQEKSWSGFIELMDGVVPRLVKLAPTKPVFVLEFGHTAGVSETPGHWADAALSALLGNRWPAVRGFSWWNETWQNDANPAHDSEMRVQAIPNLSSAFTTRLKTSSVVVDRPIIK